MTLIRFLFKKGLYMTKINRIIVVNIIYAYKLSHLIQKKANIMNPTSIKKLVLIDSADEVLDAALRKPSGITEE